MVRLFSAIENSEEELLTSAEPVLDENVEFLENEEEINSDSSDTDDDIVDKEHFDEDIGRMKKLEKELENLKFMEFTDNEETYEIV
jgi:hypothetical protein